MAAGRLKKTARVVHWHLRHPVHASRYWRACIRRRVEIADVMFDRRVCPECVLEDGGFCDYHKAELEAILHDEWGYAPLPSHIRGD